MIGVILTLALVGLVAWIVTTKIPMEAWMRTVIQVVVAIFVILYLMRVFGLADMPIPR